MPGIYDKNTTVKQAERSAHLTQPGAWVTVDKGFVDYPWVFCDRGDMLRCFYEYAT